MTKSEFQKIHESAIQPLDELLITTVGPLISTKDDYQWLKSCPSDEFPLPFVVLYPQLLFEEPDSRPAFAPNARRAILQFVHRFEELKPRLGSAYSSQCEMNWQTLDRLDKMQIFYADRFTTEYHDYTVPVMCPFDSRTGEALHLALLDVDWYLEIMYKKKDEMQSILQSFGNQIIPVRYQQWVDGIVVHPLFFNVTH